MTTETDATATAQSSAPILDMGGGDTLTIEQARAMIDSGNVTEHIEGESDPERREKSQPQVEQGSTSQEGDADLKPEATAKGEVPEPEKTPAVEMPQSWKKDAIERWSKLDPETQQYLLEADKRDQAAIKRALNEAAEQRRAIDADKKAIEAERERYLKAVSSDIESKEAEIAQRFPQIKSMADVTYLAQRALELANTGNPDDLASSQQVQAFLQAWRISQDELAVLKSSKAETERKQTTEDQTRRASYELEQNKKLAELVPEMTDPVKGAALRDRAVKMLTDDLEIPGDLLARWYGTSTGHEILSHASFQKLIVDGLRYRDLLNAPKAVVKPNLPPVQKPGTADASKNAAEEASIQALSRKLDQSGDVEDAWALFEARQRRVS